MKAPIKGKQLPHGCFLFRVLLIAGLIEALAFSLPGQNMLTNGGFTEGQTSWVLEKHAGATANGTAVSEFNGKPACKIEVISPGDVDYHIQLNQAGLRLQQGQTYTLSFWAKANQSTSIRASIMEAHPEWQELGYGQAILLSTQWQQSSAIFQARTDEANARINFGEIARQAGVIIWIADVTLLAGGQGGPSEPLAVPGKIEVEEYGTDGSGRSFFDTDAINEGFAYRSDGVDLQACNDLGGGYNLGWTSAGEWLRYSIDVQTAGCYDIRLRVAGEYSGSLQAWLDENPLFEAGLPNTGGWQQWKDVWVKDVLLPAGQHDFKIIILTGGFNLNYLDFQWTAPAPVPQGCYVGAFLDNEKQQAFENRIGKSLAFQLLYFSWKDAPNFPEQVCDSIWMDGAVPYLTWEPWDYNPAGTNYSLRSIVEGRHDTYIRRWADQIRSWNKPILLRWGHEMNGTWYPWDGSHNGGEQPAHYGDPLKPDGPELYVAAYRHIYSIFKEVGAHSVIWVWCPNVENSSPMNWNRLANYYPGDDYVDWLGLDGYNWGTSQTWSSWQSFGSIYGPSYQAITALNPDRPVMIGEFASAEKGGDKAAWITSAFSQLKTQFPRIKAVTWFNINKETDWRIDSSPPAFTAFTHSISDPYFCSSFLIIKTGFLPEAHVGESYHHQLEALGGAPPYRWSLRTGTMPLTWNLSADGRITGIPSRPESIRIAVEVTDARGMQATKGLDLKVVVEPAFLRVAKQTSEQVWLHLDGVAGQVWVIESSNDLHTWSAVGTNTINTSGLSQWLLDLTDSEIPCQFYQARLMQNSIATDWSNMATININNYDADKPLYHGGQLANGEVKVQLLGGPVGGQWKPVPTADLNHSSIFTLSEPGYFFGGIGVVEGVQGGQIAQFQLRVWLNANSYEEAHQRITSPPFEQSTGQWDSTEIPPQAPFGPSLRIPTILTIP